MEKDGARARGPRCEPVDIFCTSCSFFPPLSLCARTCAFFFFFSSFFDLSNEWRSSHVVFSCCEDKLLSSWPTCVFRASISLSLSLHWRHLRARNLSQFLSLTNDDFPFCAFCCSVCFFWRGAWTRDGDYNNSRRVLSVGASSESRQEQKKMLMVGCVLSVFLNHNRALKDIDLPSVVLFASLLLSLSLFAAFFSFAFALSLSLRSWFLRLRLPRLLWGMGFGGCYANRHFNRAYCSKGG